MDTWIWIAIAAAVVVVVALVAAGSFAGRRRRSHLKERFGPEYDRTVDSAERRREAERELRDREDRHDRLELRPLAPAAGGERYEQRWATLQSEFVDRPQVAVADADSLIAGVMRDRGYPVEDFDSNRDLLSVEHGHVIDEYRKGHDLYTLTVEGRASTEDLRQAVVAYRSLFDALIHDDDDSSAEPGPTEARSSEHTSSDARPRV